MKTCARCKHVLAEEAFATKTTALGEIVPKKSCIVCSEKMNQYNATPDRKAASLARDRDPKNKEKKKIYKTSDRGKAVQSRANRKVHRVEKQRVKRQTDPAFRLRCALGAKLGQMLHGKYRSKSILEYTDFKDADDLRIHFEDQFEEDMTMDNFGSLWHIDHIIACHWYTGSTEDLKRLWSRKNLRPMRGPDNQSKGIKLPRKRMMYVVGVENWPLSWKGQYPKRLVEVYGECEY